MCGLSFRPTDYVVCVHLFGALHISVALHLSMTMILSDGSIEVTGGNTVFSSFLVSFLPHLHPAVLTFIFVARRVQPSLSLVNNDVEVCACVLSRG